jgi:uncharacterized protein YjiS (DUF1127 family)
MTTELSPRTATAIIHFAEHRRQQLLGELIGGALGTLWLWATRWRTRQALSAIVEDRHMLADVGITRPQALREASKPFWRA